MIKLSLRFAVSVLVLLTTYTAQGQVLSFDHGKVEFSTSSIMSDIEAISEEMKASLNQETGAVEIIIPIQSFEFEYEMMQDHFNEEYLESEKYPEARFIGSITGDISNIQDDQIVDITGNMTLHGVTKPIQLKATLSKSEGMTKVKSTFPIVFKDYGVDEPSILTKSVAKDVEVKVLLYLK